MKDTILHSEDREIHVVLNDTITARDFVTRLPFYTSGYDSGIDYCCTAKYGKSDRKERQAGWRKGNINLTGGWFALLYGAHDVDEGAIYI